MKRARDQVGRPPAADLDDEVAQAVRQTDPAEAERRLLQALDLKVGGGTEEDARRLLEEVRAAAKPR